MDEDISLALRDIARGAHAAAGPVPSDAIRQRVRRGRLRRRAGQAAVSTLCAAAIVAGGSALANTTPSPPPPAATRTANEVTAPVFGALAGWPVCGARITAPPQSANVRLEISSIHLGNIDNYMVQVPAAGTPIDGTVLPQGGGVTWMPTLELVNSSSSAVDLAFDPNTSLPTYYLAREGVVVATVSPESSLRDAMWRSPEPFTLPAGSTEPAGAAGGAVRACPSGRDDGGGEYQPVPSREYELWVVKGALLPATKDDIARGTARTHHAGAIYSDLTLAAGPYTVTVEPSAD